MAGHKGLNDCDENISSADYGKVHLGTQIKLFVFFLNAKNVSQTTASSAVQRPRYPAGFHRWTRVGRG